MNVLISGSNGNLGSEVVKLFCNDGHQVIGVSNSEDNFTHENYVSVQVDLMNASQTKEEMQTLIADAGAVDIAVLTVGGFAMGSIQDTQSTDVQKQIDLNFHTAYNTLKALEDDFSENARVFLIGAKPALSAESMKDMVAYTLAKKMIFSLAEIINAEQKNGLQAHVIVPSVIDTPQNREAMPDANYSDWIKPQQIAETILFYSKARYIKGSIIKTYANS